MVGRGQRRIKMQPLHKIRVRNEWPAECDQIGSTRTAEFQGRFAIDKIVRDVQALKQAPQLLEIDRAGDRPAAAGGAFDQM